MTAASGPDPGTAGSAGDPRAAVSQDEPLVSVADLSIAAGGRRLVEEVSFTLGRGERLGVIGASGSGKTLSALALSGLLPRELAATGSVHLAGFAGDLLHAHERAVAPLRGSRIGMVFQEPRTALNPTMTIRRQVGEVLTIHRTAPRAAIADRVRSLLDATGLPEPDRIARAYPHQLSGGQRQRVVLAMALANDPDLLICDEPTTALDVTVQDRVLTLIDQRITASGAALLFISHDLAVVARMCDRILVMEHGRVVEQGLTTELLTRPRHPHTVQLLQGASL